MSGPAIQSPDAQTVETPDTRHYRVDVQAGQEGCDRCHAGTFWTIVYRDGAEDIEIGTAWGGKEFAEDICDLMNMAFEAGKEHTS